MTNPDEAIESLRKIKREFADFLDDRGKASESDTRAKVITKVLTDVCGWPERDIDRETYTDSGRIDYRLIVNSKPHVVVEAKAIGNSFEFPKSLERKTYLLDGTLVTDSEVKDAIYQVREYCDDEAIRYAIATNGDAWIVFRAVRDDNIGWRKGQARVFPSIDSILGNFTDFLNLLSYEAICSGALNQQFSSSLRTSRKLDRVTEKLFNADLPLRRNRLATDMQPLIKLVFEDIADQEELDVLQACYIHTGTLKNAANDLRSVITETLPKFLHDEGAVTVGSDADRQGFLRTIKNSVNVSNGELFLLLGAIGSGKSTFLKRFRRSTGAETLDSKTMWFAIDFLHPPEPDDMQEFVWREILGVIRSRYSEHDLERRSFLKEVFADEIAALESTRLNGLSKGKPAYQKILSEELNLWMRHLSVYVPKLVRSSCVRLGVKPVLFVDNVDQLSPSYQSDIFLLAQFVTEQLSSISVVALREESYYTANIKKTFTAYNSRKFHIASPFFRRMIENRIAYSLQRLKAKKTEDGASDSDSAKGQQITGFLTLVQGAIAENDKIARFIKATSYGNMRFALEMFCSFITSGVTDVGKMLKIYERDGWYNVAFHEFVKSIMLGDRSYYREEQSPIGNLFNTGPEPNSSHFTACRVLNTLKEHRGESSREGRGYVEVSRLVIEFESVFDNLEDLIATLDRLTQRHLIEPNTRSTETVRDASHVRITSSGWYYLSCLAETFAYLDLVLQDTPLNDGAVEYQLRQSVYAVNNLIDEGPDKLERVQARCDRVERFLEYLKAEEDRERAEFGLDRLNTPIATPIVPRIQSSFKSERDWILQRLSQNREKYREEFSYTTFDDAMFVEEDEDNDAS